MNVILFHQVFHDEGSTLSLDSNEFLILVVDCQVPFFFFCFSLSLKTWGRFHISEILLNVKIPILLIGLFPIFSPISYLCASIKS